MSYETKLRDGFQLMFRLKSIYTICILASKESCQFWLYHSYFKNKFMDRLDA